MRLVSTQVTVRHTEGRAGRRRGRAAVALASPLLALVLAGPAAADESPAAPPAPAPEAAPRPEVAPAARVAPPAATWPEALSRRNARYAVLTRVDDPESEAREALLAHAVTTRETDPASELEELRRFVAAQRGHWATVEAELVRTLDLEGERDEAVLARRSLARAHAQFARVRFPRVPDENGLLVHEAELELRIYERESLRLDRRGERLGVFATQHPDPGAERFHLTRLDHRQAAPEAVREDLRSELEIDRALAIEDGKNDQRLARELEQKEAKDEARAEAQDEAALERKAEKAEALAERAGDAAAERATERADERTDERTAEQQMLQSEVGAF